MRSVRWSAHGGRIPAIRRSAAFSRRTVLRAAASSLCAAKPLKAVNKDFRTRYRRIAPGAFPQDAKPTPEILETHGIRTRRRKTEKRLFYRKDASGCITKIRRSVRQRRLALYSKSACPLWGKNTAKGLVKQHEFLVYSACVARFRHYDFCP